MLNYLFVRCTTAIVVILGVTSLVFLLIHMVPGDPVEVMLGESAQYADAEALREALGLHLPLYAQWQNFILQIARLDLGTSLYSQREISTLLAERIPATLLLSSVAMLIAILIALPLGILAALRKGSVWDSAAMTFAIAGVSIPNFWLGPLLIMVFSLWLGWLPVSGFDGVLSLVLPALCLGTAMAALLSRMVRAALLDVLNDDYIRAARARGLSTGSVILKHALPNAALPVITVIGMQFGALLAGAVITETIFSWPGIGQLTIDAIQKRDYPVVQACILVISFTYVLVNLITDLAYAFLDPRVRLEQ